ncbi:MAG: hypothetical protein JWM12_3513 [Ilumatobacteraceae bacterium]|nr:hypothetical protein [Ilumatobacteraceae bacterium]
MSSFFAIAAGTWGLLMALSPLLQIRTILRVRSSAGVSIGYLSVLFVGFVLWFSYGLSIGNPVLIFTNIASLVMGAITITIALRFRPSGRQVTPSRSWAVDSTASSSLERRSHSAANTG